MSLKGTWTLPAGLLLVAGIAGCGERPQSAVVEAQPVTEEPKSEPTGPYVERLVEAEEYFDVAGFEAYVFRFSGGFVKCWVEVETDGKKVVFSDKTEQQWRGAMAGMLMSANASLSMKREEGEETRERPYTSEDAHGYIIFMRPSSAESTYAEVSEWNLEIRALVPTPFTGSGGSYNYSHHMKEWPWMEASEDPRHQGAAKTYWSIGGRLIADQERTLVSIKWLDDLGKRLKNGSLYS